MIRRVRRQFICITMAMLTAVLLVPLIALNVVTEAMSYNQTRNLLEQIAISETTVPELPDDMPPDGKQPRQSTDTATETGTSAAETTAETTTETTATETAAAETTAKAAPAEQPKNPVQTQRRRCSLRYRLPQRHEPLPHRRHGQPLRQEPPAHGRQSLR